MPLRSKKGVADMEDLAQWIADSIYAKIMAPLRERMEQLPKFWRKLLKGVLYILILIAASILVGFAGAAVIAVYQMFTGQG